MKKILVLVMVWVACSTSTFAFNPSDYNAFYKLNNKAVFTGLVGFIDADQEQASFLQHVFKVTEEELKTATNKNNAAAVENVLNYNFINTKSILTEEQYKKYLVFMNVNVKNETNYALLSNK